MVDGADIQIEHCPDCDYDLHGLPDGAPCPECGIQAVEVGRKRFQVRRSRAMRRGRFIAGAMTAGWVAAIGVAARFSAWRWVLCLVLLVGCAWCVDWGVRRALRGIALSERAVLIAEWRTLWHLPTTFIALLGLAVGGAAEYAEDVVKGTRIVFIVVAVGSVLIAAHTRRAPLRKRYAVSLDKPVTRRLLLFGITYYAALPYVAIGLGWWVANTEA